MKFEKDKQLHAAISAAIFIYIFALAMMHKYAIVNSIVGSSFITLFFGLFKEIVMDKLIHETWHLNWPLCGKFDIKDLYADCIGILIGIASLLFGYFIFVK